MGEQSSQPSTCVVWALPSQVDYFRIARHSSGTLSGSVSGSAVLRSERPMGMLMQIRNRLRSRRSPGHPPTGYLRSKISKRSIFSPLGFTPVTRDVLTFPSFEYVFWRSIQEVVVKLFSKTWYS